MQVLGASAGWIRGLIHCLVSSEPQSIFPQKISGHGFLISD